MKTKFNSFKAAVSRGYLRAGVATSMALGSVGAFAQATGTVDDALDAVDLSGIALTIGGLAALVVGIALVFKGPDLAKRIIRKA